MLKAYWVWGALAGITGCSAGGSSSAASDAPPVVVTRTVAATAAQCPFGGSLVESGLDRDGDGVLGDREVQTQTAVCAPGPVEPVVPVLVALAVEPAGANCALGGTAVESGPDTNGDGTLATDEIAHIDYVCGAMLLSKRVREPAGANCAAGGVAIELGPDRNGNATLDDDEVVQTQLACGDVLHADVTIHSADELAAISRLAAIEGTVVIDGTDLTAISFASLAAVDALQITHNAQLTALELPALRSGDLTIDDNPRLPACAVEAIFRLDPDGTVEQSGNDDASACASGGAR